MKVTPPIESHVSPCLLQAGCGRGDTAGAAVEPLPDACVADPQAWSAAPDFDVEKVRALRQAIADGSFQVNARVIAERLMGDARRLLLRRRPH